MAGKKSNWQDEYWLMLMQLYLRKPVGVKPTWSRASVELAMELHIHPEQLYAQMLKLRQLEEPRLEQLWRRYAESPKRLAKGVRMLREMKGFSNADAFYEGVETVESWEKDFKPIPELRQPEGEKPNRKGADVTPAMLIMVLDQYFRLTPSTMVADTPEVQDLAKMLGMAVGDVVEAMEVFQICDPYLRRDDLLISRFLGPCQQIWQRFGNERPEKLAALAAQLKEYFL